MFKLTQSPLLRRFIFRLGRERCSEMFCLRLEPVGCISVLVPQAVLTGLAEAGATLRLASQLFLTSDASRSRKRLFLKRSEEAQA